MKCNSPHPVVVAVSCEKPVNHDGGHRSGDSFVWADQDEKKYREQRDLILKISPTLTDADFDEEGGRFYGMSTNELADWYKKRHGGLTPK